MEIQSQQSGPFSKRTVGMIILDTLLIFTCGVIQTSFFPALSIFRASPDLLLSAVIGLAVWQGEKSGAVSGIGAGIMAMSLGGAGTALLPVFYMLSGYLTGIIAKINFKNNLLSWFIYMTAAAFSRSLFSFLYSLFALRDSNMLVTFANIVIPEFFMTVAFSVINYYLAKLCSVIPGSKSEHE